MSESAKEKIVIDIICDVAVLVFIIFLARYNQRLYEIQKEYSNIIIQALKIVEEPNYYSYFIGGIFFGSVLIGISVWEFKYRDQTGVRIMSIMIIVNIILLIVLLIVYSNPVFTAFVIVAGGAGFCIAAQQ